MPFMLYWSQSSPVPPCSHSSHLLSLHTPSSRRVSMHSTNHETSCTRARNGNNMAKFEQQAMQTCSIGSGVVLIPLAVLAMNLNGPATVEAGILSGATGLESFELPRLPQTDVFKDITGQEPRNTGCLELTILLNKEILLLLGAYKHPASPSPIVTIWKS